jgi:two-component system response regulator YesN
MLTALIVEKEDEHREHILSLVNWGKLGFEVIGNCGDGCAAMEIIFRQWPDIVFTNDDLSGINGIELIGHAKKHGLFCDFVIVSDTGNFEVARSAMRYGVEEYLLKPVGRDELIRVLNKYNERRGVLDGRDINEHFFQTRKLLRNSFMDSFMAIDAPEGFSIESLNQRYRFMFQEGIFQSAVIVLNGLPREEEGVFLPAVVENVRARFDPVCHEMIPYIQGDARLILIFNYDAKSGAKERLPELCSIMREHLQKRGCDSASFSVGIGLPERNVCMLKKTLETAERAVRCGILRERNKLYFYGDLTFDKFTSADILTSTLLSELTRSVEALNIKGFENALRGFFVPVSPKTNPAVMMDICWAAVEAVAEMRKDLLDSPIDSLARQARQEILNSLSCEAAKSDIISSLTAWAQAQFDRCKKEREYIRPVREAMQYIKKNCTQPLTLERVANQVHLNSSYFSTIFKKETGQNFSDYLTGCRMIEAKRLLRDSGLSISNICSAVGYIDNKHFSRIFTKLVGIKPSSYRSLHG